MDRVATVRVLAGVLILGAALGRSALRAGPPEPVESVALERIPYALGEWAGRDLSVSERALAALGSDSLLLREYRRGEEPPVWIYVDYHRSQRIGAQIHSPLACYPGAGWTIAGNEETRLGAAGSPRPARWLTLQREDDEMVAVYWYVSRWGSTARETGLKANLLRSALAGRSSDAALIRVSTPLDPDAGKSRARILRFLKEHGGRVESELPFRSG